MKTNALTLITIVLLFSTSCSNCSRKAGHKVGETVGEFAEGIEKGTEKAFDITIETSETLKSKGQRLAR